ncbi:hypothetical protein [Brachybacterium sacelli]
MPPATSRIFERMRERACCSVSATTVSRRRLPLLVCPAGKEPIHFPSARW